MARTDERGVTLLELLIAILLLGIALIGLAASFPLAMYGVTTGGYQTTATLLAQQAVERAKAVGYSDLTNAAIVTGGAVCDVATGTGTFATVAGYAGFTRCVSAEVGTPTATMTTLRVIVRFATSGGEAFNTHVVSLFSS